MGNKNNNAVVCVIAIELSIPMAHSLKEKRQQIKSLKERLKSRFNASVAEIAALDDWQTSVIGVSMISNDKRYLEKQFSGIEKMILDIKGVELMNTSVQWL